MIGTTHEQTRDFLQAIAAQIDSALTCAGESPGLCHWLRIDTPRGFVGVWDTQELGERGLVIQAYELDQDQEVTYAGTSPGSGNAPRSSSRWQRSPATWPDPA